MAHGLGMKRVREELGLAVWEVELAVETSLLRRLPDRTFDPVSVNAAKTDAERFQRLLAAEHRCNATQAAIRLGISPQRFKRLADRLAPVAVDEIQKYGRTLTIRYYRAADVDALADLVRADTELRAAARTLSRSEAARKAAATRKLNKERAVAARALLQRAMPCDNGDPIQVLVWAPWLRSESAALAEVERRRRKAQTRVERTAQRRLAWRRRWAEALGLPLERVPQPAGRPTPKAISAARDRPPPWARLGRSVDRVGG
ncbi:hypothetical protein ACIBO2_13830 [Nonomuraea sp. NPDC050022]|uniref:hypothetical protein n=1 Tax=Nonomuraea sp. NPDC050022 TaxID=3364358 RepID=UPI003793C2D2